MVEEGQQPVVKKKKPVKKVPVKKKVPTANNGDDDGVAVVKKKKVPANNNGAGVAPVKKQPVKKKKAPTQQQNLDGQQQQAADGVVIKKKAPIKKKHPAGSNGGGAARTMAAGKKKQPVVKKKKHAPNNAAATTPLTRPPPSHTKGSENDDEIIGSEIVPYVDEAEYDSDDLQDDDGENSDHEGNGEGGLQRDKSRRINKNFGGPRDEISDPWAYADPARWRLQKIQFNGGATYKTCGKVEKIQKKDISEGIKHFKANKLKYIAMLYQTKKYEYEYPVEKLEYQYIHREGTTKYEPKEVTQKGWMTMLYQDYYALVPRFKDNILPPKFRDEYTDHMTYQGRMLHKNQSNPPILPGRGMGVCDEPNIKVIGDVDPSDIHQGQVGDCWLLGAISSLAEFDGAIKRLFRKTPNLDQMPFDRPSKYVITYWDLETWTEVDIVIDERLAVDARGNLLGARPSVDGELWACYLEKAYAIHAGGWDKIVGGQCLHAWSVMLGCEYQYQITKDKKTGKYACSMRFDTHTGQWCKHANSPHDCDPRFFDCAWPDAGGGGAGQLTEDELWEHMCAWDDTNYVVAATTTGVESNDSGLVDDHAYSVIECHNDVAGTPIDLIKVRNPWGKGEIEDGEFDDDGPGWDKWPQVKEEIKPVVADDGIFYVTPREFFDMFGTIFVSASDMTEFLED